MALNAAGMRTRIARPAAEPAGRREPVQPAATAARPAAERVGWSFAGVAVLEREADAAVGQVLGEAGTERHAVPRLSRVAAASGANAPAPAVREAFAGPGRPLDDATRALFEPRLGRDLGEVRVHTGARAGTVARALGARAFTAGPDVAFAEGRYDPAGAAGRRLLAHELAHVAQFGPAAPGAVLCAFVEPGEDRDKRIELYRAAAQAGNWDDAALLLNGFNRADIDRMLAERTKDELRLLDASAQRVMAGWPPVVHEHIAVLLGPAPGSAKRGGSSGDSSVPSDEALAKKSADSRAKWQGWIDSRDATAREFGAADYADYVATMLVSGGSVMGRQIPAAHPVHPVFLDKLETATVKAQAAMGSTDFGVRGVHGQDDRPGNHAWGLAVDIDPDANPYVLNESGEKDLDALLEPVYQRIAQALLKRDTVLTSNKAGGKNAPAVATGLSTASYTQIAEESDAMVAYFSVLPAPPAPDPAAKKKPPAPLPAPRKLTRRLSPRPIWPSSTWRRSRPTTTCWSARPRSRPRATPRSPAAGPASSATPRAAFSRCAARSSRRCAARSCAGAPPTSPAPPATSCTSTTATTWRSTRPGARPTRPTSAKRPPPRRAKPRPPPRRVPSSRAAGRPGRRRSSGRDPSAARPASCPCRRRPGSRSGPCRDRSRAA